MYSMFIAPTNNENCASRSSTSHLQNGSSGLHDEFGRPTRCGEGRNCLCMRPVCERWEEWRSTYLVDDCRQFCRQNARYRWWYLYQNLLDDFFFGYGLWSIQMNHLNGNERNRGALSDVAKILISLRLSLQLWFYRQFFCWHVQLILWLRPD